MEQPKYPFIKLEPEKCKVCKVNTLIDEAGVCELCWEKGRINPPLKEDSP